MADRLALPKDRKHWEFKHGTVTFTCDADANGTARPKFYVQIIDQYRYQREWSIELTHSTLGLDIDGPTSLDRLYWVSHMYRHPGRHCFRQMTKAVAIRLMERFHYLVENYPSLLFNDEQMEADGKSLRRPRHEGFVHFAEALLDGADPTCKLLG